MRASAGIDKRFSSDLSLEKDSPSDLFPQEAGVELNKEFVEFNGHGLWRITGEFWTSAQRQARAIHEVSYRACFKPQLPAYFIKRFTKPGDIVYDPFSGRGTTAIEAALWGRRVIANDVNPVSTILSRPRLSPPSVDEVESRLAEIEYDSEARADIDLSMFYERRTEAEIASLRGYLGKRRQEGTEDYIDSWIRMVATNRLTGHSSGFFSVYSFPPNQAVSAESQAKINQQRNQTPTYRNTKALILSKSKKLLAGLDIGEVKNLYGAAKTAVFLNQDARCTSDISRNSIQLTVTSPPFLDIVQYADDNWLRCWFNCLPAEDIAERITMTKTVEKWEEVMGGVLKELFRITKEGGIVAFEVGEVRRGKVRLDEHVIPLGLDVGFACKAVLINSQSFTKTANIWGVKNNTAGTNTNRIVVFEKN